MSGRTCCLDITSDVIELNSVLLKQYMSSDLYVSYKVKHNTEDLSLQVIKLRTLVGKSVVSSL